MHVVEASSSPLSSFNKTIVSVDVDVDVVEVVVVVDVVVDVVVNVVVVVDVVVVVNGLTVTAEVVCSINRSTGQGSWSIGTHRHFVSSKK